jgi:hypothetical protein
MRVERYGNSRYWALRDTTGELVCLCVYRKGAEAVLRRLQTLGKKVQQGQDTSRVREDRSSNVVSERG